MRGGALSISGFAATNTLDLIGFALDAGQKLSFTENAAKTSGVLTVSEGPHQATVTLFGNYVAAGFQRHTDGHGGTTITYTPPAAHIEIAGKH